MTFVDNVIVGTGLSAMGCAHILLKKRKKFIILEASKFKKNSSNIKKIFFDKDSTPKVLNKKNHLDIINSKMYGGNSVIWGANSLRLFKSQFKSWPIKYDELKKYYNFAEEILNIDHFNDDISKSFKFKNFNNEKKRLFNKSILEKTLTNKRGSSTTKIGLTRLALNNNYNTYSTKEWFDMNLSKKKLKINFNSEVKSFNKMKNLIKINLKTGKKITCKNLFLCAGPISTAKIVLNSLDQNIDLVAKESSYFIAPCIFKFKNDNFNIFKNTSQLQMFDKETGIYSELKYDPDLLTKVLKKKFRFFSNLIPSKLIKKIYIITGFLPDKFSENKLIISKKLNSKKISLSWVKNFNFSKRFIKKKVINLIKSLSIRLDFIFFPWSIKYYSKGRSYHIGSSIPMCSKLNKMRVYTNKNGELNFNKNVLVCDSSNFTNIPSCSVGLTILANSMRITNIKSNRL